MSTQIRIVLTLSEEEERRINTCYADYLVKGGRASKNSWLKGLIMSKLEE